jgi:hypothetical protein
LDEITFNAFKFMQTSKGQTASSIMTAHSSAVAVDHLLLVLAVAPCGAADSFATD